MCWCLLGTLFSPLTHSSNRSKQIHYKAVAKCYTPLGRVKHTARAGKYFQFCIWFDFFNTERTTGCMLWTRRLMMELVLLSPFFPILTFCQKQTSRLSFKQQVHPNDKKNILYSLSWHLTTDFWFHLSRCLWDRYQYNGGKWNFKVLKALNTLPTIFKGTICVESSSNENCLKWGLSRVIGPVCLKPRKQSLE